MIGHLRLWWRQRQASRLQLEPAFWNNVERDLPMLRAVSPTARIRLRQLALDFVATKKWTGAGGLQLTDHIQLSIALQACLPILNLGLDWYSDWVGIVVYPGGFVIPRQIMDDDGVVHEFDEEALGEAWQGGPVLISWFDDPQEIAGINIVIHEFAHKLDLRSGAADGLPPLHQGMSRRDWVRDMSAAFDDFRHRCNSGEEGSLDPYAAESPAEFFAVASEAFFETPSLIYRDYPRVYQQLAVFYRQDSAQTTQ